MEKKLDSEKNKLLHERFHNTDMCTHCNQNLPDWEFEEECPARIEEESSKKEDSK